MGDKAIDHVLNRVTRDRRKPLVPELRQHAVAKCLLVGAKSRRLVSLARARSHDPRLRGRQPLLGYLGQRRARGSAHRAAAEGGVSLRAPRSRLPYRRERLSDRLTVGRRPHLRLVAGAAIARATDAACTGMPVARDDTLGSAALPSNVGHVTHIALMALQSEESLLTHAPGSHDRLSLAREIVPGRLLVMRREANYDCQVDGRTTYANRSRR